MTDDLPAGLSPWVFGWVCLPVTWGGFALFLWLAVPGAGATEVLAGGFGFGAPTTALAVAGLAYWRYHRQWTDDERPVVMQAFRTGRPPAGTELDERLPAAIARRRVLARRTRRYGPWVYGGLVVADLVDLIIEPRVSGVLGLVAVTPTFVYVLLFPRTVLDRLDRLETAIAARRTAAGGKD